MRVLQYSSPCPDAEDLLAGKPPPIMLNHTWSFQAIDHGLTLACESRTLVDMSATSSEPRRTVGPGQATALVLAFMLVASMGGILGAGLFLPAVAGVGALANQSVNMFNDLPADLKAQPLSQKSYLKAADGTVIAHFYTQNRVIIRADQISQPMKDAVVAIEDRRFYEHGGVDPRGIVTALFENAIQPTEQPRGASTLTQQLVKNLTLNDAVRDGNYADQVKATSESYGRKLREARYAIAMEKPEDGQTVKDRKDEILVQYLNVAPFTRTTYGIQASAQRLFSKNAKDLNYLEAATLAGITKNPTKYDPTRTGEFAEKTREYSEDRRNTVLSTMRREGYITQEEYDTGVKTPLAETLKVREMVNGCQAAEQNYKAGYFCDYVTHVIRNSPEFGTTTQERDDLLKTGGLVITTTLDLRKQYYANKHVRSTIPVKDPSGVGAVIVSLTPGTGSVVSMAQNRVYNPVDSDVSWETAINYSVDQVDGGGMGFQPGSTFKVFTLATWLKNGRSLGDTVNTDPREFAASQWRVSCGDEAGKDGDHYGRNWPEIGADKWKPANSEGGGRGNVSVRQATASSINVGYADMARQLDLCAIRDTARSMGVSRSDGLSMTVTPSFILGTNEVSPLTMAAAYGTFASGGKYCKPVAITSVTYDGKELSVPQADCKKVLSADVANGMNSALQGAFGPGGTAARVGGLKDGRPAAGKTGTTNAWAQSWFVGYTPQLSTAVWVGNSEGHKTMRGKVIAGQQRGAVYGSTFAAPAWRDYMSDVLKGTKVMKFKAASQKIEQGEKIRVPNVSGKSVKDARAELEKRGFKVVVSSTTRPSTYPDGSVANTLPGGGSSVSRGAEITIFRSVQTGEDTDDD